MPTAYYAPTALSARFYDIVAAADPAIAGDVDLYAALAGEGRQILELGTGTGRVAIGLAGRGYQVTGVDLAPAMLAQAEGKRIALSPELAERLRFVRGDVTSLALGQTFDMAIASYFLLAHLPPASWKRALDRTARHLVPGGLVALHLPIAERMAATPPPPDQPVLQRQVAEGTLTLYVAGQQFEPGAGQMDLLLDYVLTHINGRIERSRERLTYYTADVTPYAAAAGLTSASAPIPLGRTGFVHVFERID